MGSILESTDVKNKLEDLSGVVVKPGENPYNALIDMCNDEPVGSAALFYRDPVGGCKRRGAGNQPRWQDGNKPPLAARDVEISTRPVTRIVPAEGKHCTSHRWMSLETAFGRMGSELTPSTEADTSPLCHSPPQAQCAAEGEVSVRGLQGAGHRPVSPEAREPRDRAGIQGPKILHDILGPPPGPCARACTAGSEEAAKRRLQ